MKLDRKNRVEQELLRLTRSAVEAGHLEEEKVGFSTSHIADQLGLLRTNVSKELNSLLHEQRAVKITGKPVLYLSVQALQDFYGQSLKRDSYADFFDLQQELLGSPEPLGKLKEPDAPGTYSTAYTGQPVEKDIFSRLIGGEEDLPTQIKQAKAAILYPPNGLHTLIIGPTGSGKTTFSSMMYHYAIEAGKLPEDAAYVIFNCADYAENAQLLISHLFGHAKGAYTGADREKRGLIDQADGGILFLDEIHRLPPEGQEMLFSLIDRGTYRRLGEAECVRSANVLIVAATTEDPSSAILGTFLRRIPLVINLPGLDDRSLKGRMKLIRQFFQDESGKIKAPLVVDKEVLKVLLLYRCPGNIGQLRNDIQLICANAFVEYVKDLSGGVHIKLSQLSQKIKDGFFRLDEKRQEVMRDFNLNGFDTITFKAVPDSGSEQAQELLMYDEYQTRDNFYELLLDQVQELYHKGMTVPEIKEYIRKQYQQQMDKGLPKAKNKIQLDKEILAKIVTPEIVSIIEDELEASHEELHIPLDPRIIYGLALHIETMVERLRQGEVSVYPNIPKVRRDHPLEYGAAARIRQKVETCLGIQVAEDENAFMAMFIYSMSLKKEAKAQVLVISHGTSTASNMVRVAEALLDCDCLHALDMPMEAKVSDTLSKAMEMVKRIDRGNGVMLLVDMGSLATFSEIITKHTGIPTKSIQMVSTPMVIEAARKAMIPDISLDEIEQSVLTMSSFIGGRVRVKEETELAAQSTDKSVLRSGRPYSERIIAMMEDVLTFLNVKKVCRVLDEVLNKLAEHRGVTIDDVVRLKFLLHCSCMIERSIRNEPLPYRNFRQMLQAEPELSALVRREFERVEEVFGTRIADTEMAYIVEMLHVLL